LHKDHILVIADLHLPFEKKGYLDFCKQIQKRVECGTVVMIGDLVDNHSLSLKFSQDPNGYSPKDEIDQAKHSLREWYKAFPEVLLCLGNHDRRVDLKGKHVGLPECVFRPFRDIWGLPSGWKDDFSHEIDGVLYTHGTGYSGDNAHLKAAVNARQSCVIGHVHHICTTGYTASDKDCIFGMAVGTGIDVKKYAFAYERHFPKKPIVGLGVVTDRGKNCQVFRMDL
jgi:predicted phosphodiesterase